MPHIGSIECRIAVAVVFRAANIYSATGVADSPAGAGSRAEKPYRAREAAPQARCGSADSGCDSVYHAGDTVVSLSLRFHDNKMNTLLAKTNRLPVVAITAAIVSLLLLRVSVAGLLISVGSLAAAWVGRRKSGSTIAKSAIIWSVSAVVINLIMTAISLIDTIADPGSQFYRYF